MTSLADKIKDLYEPHPVLPPELKKTTSATAMELVLMSEHSARLALEASEASHRKMDYRRIGQQIAEATDQAYAAADANNPAYYGQGYAADYQDAMNLTSDTYGLQQQYPSQNDWTMGA